MAQQARNVAWELEGLEIPIKAPIHDRDSKYVWHQDRPSPVSHPPRANAACERVLGSVRRECLDWMITLGERHLVQVLREYFDHYNRARPHRALLLGPPHPQPILESGLAVRRQRL